jgi:hypothetical protein
VRTRRTASLAKVWATVVLAAAAAGVLAGCTYSAEPAPGQPTDPNQYSTEGFPAPGPPPVPGQFTPAPVVPPAPANVPRPANGPTPTQGPAQTGTPAPSGG